MDKLIRKTPARMRGLSGISDGSLTHPGSASMGYLFEREGLAVWVKSANRYLPTDKGLGLLSHWRKTSGLCANSPNLGPEPKKA